MAHLGWQAKMSILVFMSVTILVVMSNEEKVKNPVEQIVEKKEADGKQSLECNKGTVGCTWDKLKAFTNSAFQRMPSVKKTGEVLKDSVSKSFQKGKGSAADTGEKTSRLLALRSSDQNCFCLQFLLCLFGFLLRNIWIKWYMLFGIIARWLEILMLYMIFASSTGLYFDRYKNCRANIA